jgi:glycosyltransferase involved in cell wall biosynthesis
MRLYERLQLRAIRRASAVIAVSRGVATRVARAGVAAHRIHQIANAYAATTPMARDAARAHLGITGTTPQIAWIGRMSQEKGADVMIDALAQLSDLPVTVSLIGDGPNRQALQAQAAARGVADRLRWHGLVPNAAQLLPAFDGFVLSSRSEGTPMVILEAMAARVPIVATQVGGIPDMLTHTEAWLVPPETPHALAHAIRAMIAHPHEAHTRAARAHDRLVADFDVEAWLDRYEAVYASIQRPAVPASESLMAV